MTLSSLFAFLSSFRQVARRRPKRATARATLLPAGIFHQAGEAHQSERLRAPGQDRRAIRRALLEVLERALQFHAATESAAVSEQRIRREETHLSH